MGSPSTSRITSPPPSSAGCEAAVAAQARLGGGAAGRDTDQGERAHDQQGAEGTQGHAGIEEPSHFRFHLRPLRSRSNAAAAG